MESTRNPKAQKHEQESLRIMREFQSRYAASHAKLHRVKYLKEVLLWPLLLTSSRNQDWLCGMSKPLFDDFASMAGTKLFSHLTNQTTFTAIDFEGHLYPSELEISIMERCELQHIESVGMSELKGIRTLHYQCTDVKRKREHEAFRFGDSQNCSLEELPFLVESILKTNNVAPGPDLAPTIVLVGHEMRSALEIPARMGTDLENADSIVGILDTKQLAFEILGIERLQNASSPEDAHRLLIHNKAGSFHTQGMTLITRYEY